MRYLCEKQEASVHYAMERRLTSISVGLTVLVVKVSKTGRLAVEDECWR